MTTILDMVTLKCNKQQVNSKIIYVTLEWSSDVVRATELSCMNLNDLYNYFKLVLPLLLQTIYCVHLQLFFNGCYSTRIDLSIYQIIWTWYSGRSAWNIFIWVIILNAIFLWVTQTQPLYKVRLPTYSCMRSGLKTLLKWDPTGRSQTVIVQNVVLPKPWCQLTLFKEYKHPKRFFRWESHTSQDAKMTNIIHETGLRGSSGKYPKRYQMVSLSSYWCNWSLRII